MTPQLRFNKLSAGILLVSVLSFSMSQADITSAFRQSNAVVWYNFNETSGQILDRADAKFGAPLNLQVMYPASVNRPGAGTEIADPNLIRSTVAADKITNECKARNAGVTIEVWVKNNESVERRSNTENGQQQNARPRPLVIMGLMNDFNTRNFVVGQFYDNGNFYVGGVNTSSNEATKGNSLQDPIMSKVSATLVPNSQDPRPMADVQKIILSVDTSGVGNLYLSDRNGNMYLAETKANGFGGDMSKWRTGAYLTFGNNYIPDANLATEFAKPPFAASCATTDTNCLQNQNRYWKGKLSMAAVYCKALTREDVLGTALQLITNPQFEIDPATQVTAQRQKAQEIYARMTGVNTPIVNPALTQMEAFMNAGDYVGAAGVATQDPQFYSIVVRDFAAKMSNRDETINTPLNDFTATIIGAVRDDLNAKKLLTDNITYQADPSKAAVPSDMVDDILRSNNHYAALGSGKFDLGKVLVQKTQQLYNGSAPVANPSPAGLLTSRQWMAAHAIAGTNRRLVEYTFRQFLCSPMETVADSSGPDNVIGPDIDRFPGGSHAKFTTTCKACHTIMDGFRPAFSRYTFSNNFVKHSFIVPVAADTDDENMVMGMKQNPPYITEKLNHNATVFPSGRIVKDDSWVNNANLGSNAMNFGWTKTSGVGLKEFGQLISESKKYPHCLAERVFKSVCKRDPASSDANMLNKVTDDFKARNYNLKYLFQRIVTTQECLGGN